MTSVVSFGFSLKEFTRKARIRFFGHVLRLPTDTPAQKAMEFYFKTGKIPKGRPNHLLPTRLKKDFPLVVKGFKTIYDLQNLRRLASARQGWKDIFEQPS